MEIDRYRSLLGVRSSERYQNDRKELYFQLVYFVSGFDIFASVIFPKTRLTPSQKPNFQHLAIRGWCHPIIRHPRFIISGFEISASVTYSFE